MSSMLLAELVATCNALGIYDDKNKKYFIDSYTLDTVKDLIRYLRRDGDDHEIRRHLGQTKVLQTDLIPMMISHSDKTELFEVTLRLLVNLTNPTLLLYREEMPTERSSRNHYLQMVGHLQTYKEEAFANADIWEVFAKKLMTLLEKDWTERDDDSSMCIERILILMRNVLHVPADTDRERKPDSDANVHDKVLWALNQSSIMDIILYLSTENEKQYLMHVLEIISLIMREQNPSNLADAALLRSDEEKIKDEQELLQIRMNENHLKNLKVKQLTANRHSRFGGTYVVKNMKSISDNDIICHKPLSTVMKLDFDSKKTKVSKPKNRRPQEAEDHNERRSAFAIRLFLKEFCVKFLNMAYNPLMNYAKDVLVRAKAQQNDESYYLWAMKFFMEFNRVHDFQVKYVSETISVPTFHYVQQQMEKYCEMIKMDQKKFPLWIKRLHLALKAYRELLYTLMEMEKATDPSIREATKVLESNIFYVLEYREFILNLMLTFDEHKMPKIYLRDLVETAHIFVKMLERFCKKNSLVVQKKVRGKTRQKKPRADQQSQKSAQPRNRDLEWEVIGPQLLAVFRSDAEISTDVIPFDAASDIAIDDQRGECMKKIQKLMTDHKFEDAIALLRAAREIWPLDGVFGATGMEIDAEYGMMETIYMADIGVEAAAALEDNANQNHEERDDDNEEEDKDEDEISARVAETEFDFPDFISRFARPQVVMACGLILQDYDKVPNYTWHCALKMLHRIAWDCKFHAMICQASIFRTFQRILENDLPQFKELRKFGVFIVRKFTEIAQTNPHAFMDLLFWKRKEQAYEMDYGYNETYDKHGKNLAWTPEQEDELRILFNENQQNPSTEKDVIDWIQDNLIDHTKSRRSVIKKLKELGLIFKAPTRKSNKMAAAREKVPIEFDENEDETLKDLWDQLKETRDPMSAIAVRMPKKRPKKRYVERLLELGVVQTKNQCRTKRSNKSGSREDGSDQMSSGSDESDDDGIEHRNQSKKHEQRGNATADLFKRPTTALTPEMASRLIAAVDAGYSEALNWIVESLEEMALDQEAEGFDPDADGIPLVPISEISITAMESDTFRATLKAIGIVAPFDEQEMYWRIPSTLHHTVARLRNENILKAIAGTLIIPDDTVSLDVSASSKINASKKISKHDSSSEEDDVFTRVRSYGVDVEDIMNNGDDNLPIDNNTKSVSVTGTSRTSRKKISKKTAVVSSKSFPRHSSSEDDDVFARVRSYGVDVDNIINNDEANLESLESKRKRNALESSDDSNNTNCNISIKKKRFSRVNRIHSNSDESDNEKDDQLFVDTQSRSCSNNTSKNPKTKKIFHNAIVNSDSDDSRDRTYVDNRFDNEPHTSVMTTVNDLRKNMSMVFDDSDDDSSTTKIVEPHNQESFGDVPDTSVVSTVTSIRKTIAKTLSDSDDEESAADDVANEKTDNVLFDALLDNSSKSTSSGVQTSIRRKRLAVIDDDSE